MVHGAAPGGLRGARPLGDVLPGGERRCAGGAPAARRLLRGLHRRRARDRRRLPHAEPAQLRAGIGSDRHRRRWSASRSASSSSASTAACSRASSRCSSAPSSASPPARSSSCSPSRSRRSPSSPPWAGRSSRLVDELVARAGGVPVRLLDVAFLLVLGLAVAATAQITGVLLVFALLVAPAAAAQQLTARIGARDRAQRRDRAPRHLARARACLLHELLGRLLRQRPRASPSTDRPRATAVRPPARARRPARSRGDPRLDALAEFIRNALIAGTPIALACGAVGYFVVLRGQVFAGDDAQPRRLHRRSRRRRGRRRPPPRPVRGHHRRSAAARSARRPRRSRRRGDRDRLRLGARARRLLPRPLQPRAQRRQRHHRRSHPVRLDLRPEHGRGASSPPSSASGSSSGCS